MSDAAAPDTTTELPNLARRVAADAEPLRRLEALAELEACLEVVKTALISEARDAGHSSAVIGSRLGISRQAVAKRLSQSDEPAAHVNVADTTPKGHDGLLVSPTPTYVAKLPGLPFRLLHIHRVDARKRR